MAQPEQRRRARPEAEEVRTVRALATEAATAYRDYIIGGDPTRRTRFWAIYNQAFRGATLHDNREFMDALFTELERVGENAEVRPVLDAFIADRGRLFGFLWRNPVHFTDFIDTVHNIRTALERGIATDAQVSQLVRQTGTSAPARADTPVGRVRADVQAGTTLEEAARNELERTSREDAAQRYGENLTREIVPRMPTQLARRCAIALRGFILTGNDSQRAEFRRIFDGNTSAAFMTAFTTEFSRRIYSDQTAVPGMTRADGQPLTLSDVAQAYNTRHNGTDPNEFANMVARLYTAAASGTAEELERMRQAEGTDVVDPLLRVVAAGMAGRAITLMRQVLESGDMGARDQFVRILNGRLAIVVDGAVQTPTVENNDVFWNEFTRMYSQEITQNSRLASLVRSFGRNVLPIALRDIYAELARSSPDMTRLESDYGATLVRLVREGMGSTTWIMRPEADLNREINTRAQAEDPAATRIRAMRVTFHRGRALGETYGALVDERVRRRAIAPEALRLIEANYDQLSYLSGTPADVQAELQRRSRARPPEALATQLLAAFPANAGETLSSAYREITALRQRREQLVQSYGSEWVTFVSQNIDNLGWVLRPVEQIETEMRSRRAEPFVRGVNTAVGYSVGNLAHALRDIYAETGRGASGRDRLVQAYGADLVQFVETNRARLGWLGGDLASVERTLQDPATDPATRELQGRWLYAYTPVQLVSAIARARSAISRGGLVLADARDAYGTIFLAPVVARQAAATPSRAPEAAQARQAEIESRARSLESELENLEGQLRYSILDPARILLQERIRMWRQENIAIRLEARTTSDPAVLETLVQRQRTLNNTMLSGSDLRRAVEMAFAMIHMAETGGDVRLQAPQGVTMTDIDMGSLNRLLQWYNGLAGTGKQQVVGEVVGAVMRRADPQLFDFIAGMDEPGLRDAVASAYNLTQGRGGTNRQGLVTLYGEQFVRHMEANAPHLRVLESPAVMQNPAAMMAALARGENELFAAIVIRCHRATTSPTATENRDLMVRLFGEQFVLAVEANREALAPLAQGSAGLPEVRALPQAVRRALMAAYPGAHTRVVSGMMRAFRHQDEHLFRSTAAVYAVMRERPQRGAPADQVRAFEARTRELYETYGERFVRAIADNMTALGFMQSPSVSVADLSSRTSPELLETLNSAFEQGPGAGRANFMQNYVRLATRLPRFQANLRSALVLSNPTDRLARDFQAVVDLYHQEFGTNYYLFNQYFNLDLLSRSVTEMGRRYSIEFPPYIADGIQSPAELARFLGTETGQELIRAGRTAFSGMETQYLQARQDRNWHPTTGDFTDANVSNLRNEISIIDALYLGIALQRISGTDSAMQRASAQAVMNSILVISHRDPYLLGPYLLQVLPAVISVAQDERTLIAALEAFNQIFTQRYESGTRDIAYSTALNRRYFLEVFARIGQRLPEVVSTYDHSRLEDELRLTPEPRTDEGYMSPMLYRYRPGFWQGEGLEPLPGLYGQYGAPLSLLPSPVMPSTTSLPVGGATRVDSGAGGLFSSMYDQLRPPAARLFNMRVPARFRIGALGSSTIIRRINELFGPMPVDYNDYWLSGRGETGAFYAHEDRGTTSTDRGGAAGVGAGRTISGGVAGDARWTRDQTTSATPGGAGEPTREQRQTTDTVDINASAVRVPMPLSGPVPLPLAGIIPYDAWRMGEGVGIHRARQEFHYETASTEDALVQPGGERTGTEYQTRGRTRGLLETYQRIARESQTDMLLFVSGEHVPELRGPASGGAEGPVVQEGEGRLRSRLFFVTREGNIYQLAYGIDTQSQLMNYLYAGANTQQFLASVRSVGREMLTGDSAAGGFDGAAVGFTLPRSGGDTFSALAFGQLVRNLSSMDPVHAEQAVGMAVTNLLASRTHRDVYAAFYRGAEITTVDAADRTRIADTRFAEGTGEVMWRRVRIDPMAYQAEVRAVGGYPLTVGARGRVEWRPSRYRTNALGLTAAYSHLDLLREFRVADTQADQVYSGLNSLLVSFYNWSEDEARDTGHLVAGSYLWARMEDWVLRNPDGTFETQPTGPEGNPDQHFASAMLMYWAQRHGILMGAQRVPGWGTIYQQIDQAMTDIQRNPGNEATILTGLSTSLRQALQRDIWRFSLGYGYDGERVRVYIVGGGQWTGDETAYGNLYGLFLFGRPATAFADILGHAYGARPIIIREDPTAAGGFQVDNPGTAPYLDLYGGFGLIDWPSISLHRYERRVAVTSAPDVTGALRDVYRELGGARNRSRLVRLYGESIVTTAEENAAGLNWMIRPRGEVRTELQSRLDEEDPVAMAMMNLRRGTESGRQAVRDQDAAAIIDIYTELRKASPDRERLEREYPRELVTLVERNAVDLDYILLPPDRMTAEFRRRAGRSGTPEARIAEVAIPAGPTQDELTGEEVRRLVEQNLPDVLVAATDAASRVGLNPERYDIILGSHLTSPAGRDERHSTYYVLHTPVGERPNSAGSLVIGDETDLDEWIRRGHEIGRGISRLEISREGQGYNLTFSGDRRARALTAARAVGGVTIPLRSSDYEHWQASGNWTVGALIHAFQNDSTDILAGALYGTRTFGNEQWNQWTVTVSGRVQGTNTATLTEQHYFYLFFNSASRQVVFASGDVFENADEMREVCRTLSDGRCSSLTELQRFTGGAGYTWARTDVITGNRINLHLFFEGGSETYSPMLEPSTPDGRPSRDSSFVFRAGAGFEYITQPESSTTPTHYFLNLAGQSGTWPLMPGSVTAPEQFPTWADTIGSGYYPSWGVMLHGGVRW